ncbi:hypothetical protein CIB84_016353, partial [Bambusicola thoracicus]
MAAGGAAEAQARFGHSVKGLLTEKVTSCGTDVIALTKQVLKGSRSAEVSGGARQDGAEGQGRAGQGRAGQGLSPPAWRCPSALRAFLWQLLGQAARNMVMQEDAILHSEDSLRKMAIITTHLQYQYAGSDSEE